MFSDGGNSKTPLFSSETEAAIAAAAQMYYLCETYRIEYSTLIYSVTSSNKTYYSFGKPVYGTPHECNPLDGLSLVPESAQVVAYVHTHPNAGRFSTGDINFANKHNWNAYVAIPSHEILMYKANSSEDPINLGGFTPVIIQLSQDEINILEEIWYGHFKKDGSCKSGFDSCKNTQ